MRDRQLGVLFFIAGAVIVVLDLIYTLYLKAIYPKRFHLVGFHPIVDSVAIIGIVLLLAAGYIWLIRKPKF